MANEGDNTIGSGTDERGGIQVRDYTRGGRPSALKRFNVDLLARGLVFVSLGLGLMEVLAPKRVQKFAGIKKGNYSWIIRLAGLREITHAMLIFMQSRPVTGVWSRIVGDAMDLGLLGAAFTMPRVERKRLNAVTASVAGIAALDAITAAQMTRKRANAKGLSAMTQSDLERALPGGGFFAVSSVFINSSPNEVYQFWRNFENLPRFMYHVEDVWVKNGRRSHWVVKAPAGMKIEWDAEITDDRPNELIAWQTVESADVPNSGEVRFEPGPNGRGTVVRVRIEYHPPAGRIGRVVAQLFGEEPGQSVKGDLGRLKQVIETGEVIRSDASPDGLGEKKQRPAQPLPDGQAEKIINSEKMGEM